MDPLIVTLDADPASARRFEALRQRHFPPERNLVPAHVTVFHALPGERLAEVSDTLATVARSTAPLPFRAVEVMAFGRAGTALRIDCGEARTLKRQLQHAFALPLTPQDAGGLRPHVTIQNKVPPDVAAVTRERARAEFAPFDGRFVGLALWHYRGGPWDEEARFAFPERHDGPR
jgi:2'-5' RNA ligase